MLHSLSSFFSTTPAGRRHALPKGWWLHLAKGAELSFGVMSPEGLSQATFAVSDIHRYGFDGAELLSYVLVARELDEEGEPLICQMIIADTAEESAAEEEGAARSADGRSLAGRYMAISRRLTEAQLYRLCAEEDVEQLQTPKDLHVVYVREMSSGMPDWVTMRYIRRMGGIQGHKMVAGVKRHFEYTLLVSDDDSKAIEVECYEDGRVEVYVTVYRPLADVVGFTPAPLAMAELNGVALNGASPNGVAVEAEIEPEPESFDALLTQNSAEPETAMVAPSEEDAKLACPTAVAAKLLNEAVRNDMRVGDVVKKIVGLPVATEDQVWFDLGLSDADYVALAKRFGVRPQDRAVIHAKVAESLVEFTGEKPKVSH